jgi:hypothetical protein
MDWLTFIIALIGGLPALLAAVAAFVQGLRNASNIEAIHRTVNSRMDQMINLTQTKAFAEGAKSETDKGGARGTGSHMGH